MLMQKNPVGWFEIPVNDIEKAGAFYKEVFSCELQTADMGPAKMLFFPFDHEGPGATGALVKMEGYIPSHSGSTVYFSVEDIEGALERVKANGGKELVAKMSIGEHGFIAQFEDCEGNRVSLWSKT